jgi:DNA-binding response OmpR family regulator
MGLGVAKARVLIVEDEPMIASSIESVLEQNGYACAGICFDLKTCDPIVDAGQVDIALLDVLIREEGPYELCKRLEKRGIPFGFVSGVERETIKKRWRERPFLGKPFGDEQLLALVEQLDAERSTK